MRVSTGHDMRPGGLSCAARTPGGIPRRRRGRDHTASVYYVSLKKGLVVIRFREARDSPGFLCQLPFEFFACYTARMDSQSQFPDELLGPFSAKSVEEATLGPFATETMNHTTSPWDVTRAPETDRPMLDSMGVTPAEFRSLLDANDGARQMLSQPEAESLHAYLGGTKNYDVHVLNNLFAELSAGFKSRMTARDQVLREQRVPRIPRNNPSAPSWALEGTSTGTWAEAPPPAETGESPQPPTEWWLEGK